MSNTQPNEQGCDGDEVVKVWPSEVGSQRIVFKCRTLEIMLSTWTHRGPPPRKFYSLGTLGEGGGPSIQVGRLFLVR